MLSVVRDASADGDPVPGLFLFRVLVEDKVWQHLGLTLEEFLAGDAAGVYVGDDRPEVVALMDLLCTGAWHVAGPSMPLSSTKTIIPRPRTVSISISVAQPVVIGIRSS